MSAIAERIASDRGECSYITVWRVIRRLNLQPYTTSGAIKFYTEEQATQIAAELRAANRKKTPQPATA